jgi:hypothetical protein
MRRRAEVTAPHGGVCINEVYCTLYAMDGVRMGNGGAGVRAEHRTKESFKPGPRLYTQIEVIASCTTAVAVSGWTARSGIQSAGT